MGIVYIWVGNFGKDNKGNFVIIDGYYFEKIGGGKINILIDVKDYSIGVDGIVIYIDVGDVVYNVG